jgi:hypothetical protein
MERRIPSAVTTSVTWLEVVCGVVAVSIPLTLAVFITRYTVNAPYYDEFDWAPLIFHSHAGTLTFGELWTQHNDHRLFFGNLIALGLERLGGWNQLRECWTSLAVAIVGQAFLLGLLRSSFPARTAFMLLVLDSFLLFSLSQENNWIWGFQTAWILISTCVLGLMWSLSGSTITAKRLALATAFAFVASFSLLFGLNVWPAGFLVLVLHRPFERRLVLTWIGLAIVVLAVYFYQYDFLFQGSASAANHVSVWTLPTYFFAFLGAPLGNWAGPVWSAVLGALGTISFAGMSAALLTDVPASTSRHYCIPWLGLGAFAILCAALTTAGRAGIGIGQALDSRYSTPATLFWIAILSLGAFCLQSLRPHPAVRFGASAVLAFGAALFVCASLFGFTRMESDHDVYSRAYYTERHVMTASDDDLRDVYPVPSQARSYLERLARMGQGPAATSIGGCPLPCR